MRLLRTQDCVVVPFSGNAIPRYAILSHTWGGEGMEVTMEDLSGEVSDITRKKTGYEKVIRSCKQALDDGYDYIWIDSCCIKQNDPNELQESLNSMYKWYMRASVCYVLFDDFDMENIVVNRIGVVDGFEYISTEPSWEKRLATCRWFQRGWTLQEHVAPTSRVYFDRQWRQIDQHVPTPDLEKVIEDCTGIQRHILGKQKQIHSLPVSCRMRWAAGRETTKGEDLAYSLLGIFNVQMNLMYGEGKDNAFLRLQKKIIKKYDDESIFAWETQKPGYLGLLAESPDCFMDCSKMAPDPYRDQSIPWNMTNKGLIVSLLMSKKNNSTNSAPKYTVFLNLIDRETRKCPTFTLSQIGKGTFVRKGELRTDVMKTIIKRQEVIVPQESRPNLPPIKFSCLGYSTRLHWKPVSVGGNPEWSTVKECYTITRTYLKVSVNSHVAPMWLGVRDSEGHISQLCSVGVCAKIFPHGWCCIYGIVPAEKFKVPNAVYLDQDSLLDTQKSTMVTIEHRGYEITVDGPSFVMWDHGDDIKIRVTIKKTKFDETLITRMAEMIEISQNGIMGVETAISGDPLIQPAIEKLQAAATNAQTILTEGAINENSMTKGLERLEKALIGLKTMQEEQAEAKKRARARNSEKSARKPLGKSGKCHNFKHHSNSTYDRAPKEYKGRSHTAGADKSSNQDLDRRHNSENWDTELSFDRDLSELRRPSASGTMYYYMGSYDFPENEAGQEVNALAGFGPGASDTGLETTYLEDFRIDTLDVQEDVEFHLGSGSLQVNDAYLDGPPGAEEYSEQPEASQDNPTHRHRDKVSSRSECSKAKKADRKVKANGSKDRLGRSNELGIR